MQWRTKNDKYQERHKVYFGIKCFRAMASVVILGGGQNGFSFNIFLSSTSQVICPLDIFIKVEININSHTLIMHGYGRAHIL